MMSVSSGEPRDNKKLISKSSFFAMHDFGPNRSFKDVFESLQLEATDMMEAPRAVRHACFAPLFESIAPAEKLRADMRCAYDYAAHGGAPPAADSAAISRELGVDAHSSPLAIRQARRRFALRNHPDRVPPELREIATTRMRLANEMLDAWLKEK